MRYSNEQIQKPTLQFKCLSLFLRIPSSHSNIFIIRKTHRNRPIINISAMFFVQNKKRSLFLHYKRAEMGNFLFRIYFTELKKKRRKRSETQQQNLVRIFTKVTKQYAVCRTAYAQTMLKTVCCVRKFDAFLLIMFHVCVCVCRKSSGAGSSQSPMRIIKIKTQRRIKYIILYYIYSIISSITRTQLPAT